MNGLNLIPIDRRRARARGKRLRAWIVLNSLYLLLLLAGSSAMVVVFSSDRSSTAELTKVNQGIEDSSKQMLIVRRQLAEAQELMTSVKAISEQPDWSIVMAVVAEAVGDNVVLSRCELAPVTDETPIVQVVSVAGKPSVPVPPAPRRVMLHLSGLGQSQAQVAQFVLRLEGTNLFEHVSLLHTNRQVLMGADAVGFELDCPLAGRMGGTP